MAHYWRAPYDYFPMHKRRALSCVALDIYALLVKWEEGTINKMSFNPGIPSSRGLSLLTCCNLCRTHETCFAFSFDPELNICNFFKGHGIGSALGPGENKLFTKSTYMFQSEVRCSSKKNKISPFITLLQARSRPSVYQEALRRQYQSHRDHSSNFDFASTP